MKVSQGIIKRKEALRAKAGEKERIDRMVGLTALPPRPPVGIIYPSGDIKSILLKNL